MNLLRLEFEFKENELEVVRNIGHVADKLSLPTYVVGGFVRDRIIGRESKDIDVVCVGNGIDLATAFAKSLPHHAKISVFKRFGTAMVNFENWEIEFVGARKESYSQDSRKPAVENGSLEDDQNRRDFTINAMAVCINGDGFGELIDPFDGMADLERRIIRTPMMPDKTFSDDPLRMLRAIRFASQLQFDINPSTFESIKRNAHRLKIISQERIISEFNKIILSPIPSVGFLYLDKAGLLELILPSFIDLKGAEIKSGKSHKDNFYHTLEVLDNISMYTDSLWLRWAAILHDIGKPATKRFQDGVGWTFHGHEVVGARMVPKIFKKLKLPLDAKMKYVQKLVLLHLRPISLTNENITDSAIRRLLFDAGDDLEDLITLCKADITSKNEYRKKRYRDNYEKVIQKIYDLEERDEIRNWQPPITGSIIMDHFQIKPSKEVGLIKDAIREAILDGKIKNTYAAAFDYMIELGDAIIVRP